jgi:hypothetical protein
LSLGLLIVDVSRSHSVKHTALGRTPLDERLVRRIGLYLTTHINHKKQTSIRRRDSNPQSQKGAAATKPSDGAATGIGICIFTVSMPLTSLQPRTPNPNYLHPSVCGIKFLHSGSWNIAGEPYRTKTMGSAECFYVD